jgi:hypothetical protein
MTLDPGSVRCSGFFFGTVKVLYSSYAQFAGVCVAAATMLKILDTRGGNSWNERRPY